MLDKLYAFLSTLPGLPRPRMPKAVTRRRLYDTVAAVLGVLVVWGVIDQESVAPLLDSWDKLSAIAVLILARRNTKDSLTALHVSSTGAACACATRYCENPDG